MGVLLAYPPMLPKAQRCRQICESCWREVSVLSDAETQRHPWDLGYSVQRAQTKNTKSTEQYAREKKDK